MRILTFSDFTAHTNPLYKELKILKIQDSIVLQNCLFVHDYFNDKLPSSFNNIFTKVDNTHSFFTRNSADGLIAKASYNTTTYGLKSIYNQCVESWNNITISLKKEDNQLPPNLYNMNRNKVKQRITDLFLNSY